MPQSFFIWNNADCRSKGIILSGPVAIVRPEERVKHTEIPGRSGDLTQIEGEQIYNSYIQTATIQVRGGYRVREVYGWLRGAGYVTFSGEPDRRQKARIIGAVTLNKHSHNMDVWSGEVQFYCQPLKEKLREVSEEVESGDTVRNGGDVPARPLMIVTCTGDGNGGRAPAVITVDGRTLTVDDCSATDVLRIDCDAMTVTNPSMTSNWTKWSSGAFPELQPGDNTVTGSGWSKIEITKRERFL